MRIARSRGTFLIGGALASIFLLLAAWGAGWAGERENTTLKIVFASPPNTPRLTYLVAKELKWFEREGLSIEEVWVTGDANAIRTMLGGGADLSGPGVYAVYSAIAEGARIKAIASWMPRVEYVLLTHKKISSVADLKSGTIAAARGGGRGDLIYEMFRLVFDKHGVDMSGTKVIGVGGHEHRMQAVLAERADATMVSTLFGMTAIERDPDVHILATMKEEIPNLGYVYLVATDEAIRTKAPAIEKFVRYGIIESSRYIVQNPDHAAEILQKYLPDLDPGLIKKTVRELARTRVFGVNGGLDPSVTRFTLDRAVASKSVSRPLQVEDVLDPRFVQSTLEKIGRFD